MRPRHGAAPPRILLAGHSHLEALAEASARDDGMSAFSFIQMLEPGFQPNVKSGEAGLVLHEALESRIRGVLDADGPPVSMVVDCISGNEYHFVGLVNHPRPFDFVLPAVSDLALQPGAEIVPFTAIEATIRRWMEHALAVLGALRRAIPALPMVHVQSPPPVAEETHIRANPQPFRKAIEAYGVAPALFRWKLWRLQSDIYAEACRENGITFLPTPAEALDPNGFLVRDCWNPDPTHANGRFGEMVLRQINTIAQKLAAA